MAATLFPLTGYPFALDVQIDYHLRDAGLSVTTTATNVGDQPCPYGCGQHPYLSPGEGLIDDATLHLDAGTRILTDPDRELPTGTEPVAGTPYDFRGGKKLGDLTVDYAFTDLHRDADGAPGSACPGPTDAPSSYGSTTPTRSSSSTPATPWHPTGAAAGWAPSR